MGFFFQNRGGFPRNGECLKSKVSKNSYKTYKNQFKFVGLEICFSKARYVVVKNKGNWGGSR